MNKVWVVVEQVDHINLGYTIVKAFNESWQAENCKKELENIPGTQKYKMLEMRINS